MDEKTIRKISYPKICRLDQLYPTPKIALNKPIYWTAKEDGSNIGAYLDEDDEVRLRSRNQINASNTFYNAFEDAENSDKIRDLLLSYREATGNEIVVFLELLKEGWAPARSKKHEKNAIKVFDIYSCGRESFLPFDAVTCLCGNRDIPHVELLKYNEYMRIEDIESDMDVYMKTKVEDDELEGVVGKIYKENGGIIFFKKKLEKTRYPKRRRKKKEKKPKLPQLPESEILGALDKAYVDLGDDGFMDKTKAMPLFAKYVSMECDKHNCQNSHNLFDYYMDKLKEVKNDEAD